MGGGDRAEWMAGVYELDGKSSKWWKNILYRMFAFSAVNTWVIYKKLHRRKKLYLDFLVELSEELIERGENGSTVKHRSGTEWPSKRVSIMQNVATHLLYQGSIRRRCSNCGKAGNQKRTLIVSSCAIPKWVAIQWACCELCFLCYAYKFSFCEYISLLAMCLLVHVCTSTY